MQNNVVILDDDNSQARQEGDVEIVKVVKPKPPILTISDDEVEDEDEDSSDSSEEEQAPDFNMQPATESPSQAQPKIDMKDWQLPASKTEIGTRLSAFMQHQQDLT